MGIRFTHKGDFHNAERFLKKVQNRRFMDSILSKYGPVGVAALAAATPIDSGITAASWSASVETMANGIAVVWSNSNVNKGVNIAIILQYGHGTGTGGYVAGRDYINPALRPVFDQIAAAIWNEVTS